VIFYWDFNIKLVETTSFKSFNGHVLSQLIFSTITDTPRTRSLHISFNSYQNKTRLSNCLPIPITDLVSSDCFLQESLAPKNVMFIYCLFICLFVYIRIYMYIYMFKVCFQKNLWTDPPTMKAPLCQRPWRGGAQFHPRLHEPLLRSLQFPADSHPGALLSSGHPGNPRCHAGHGTGLENMKDLGVIR
jgi:hypothetical protein